MLMLAPSILAPLAMGAAQAMDPHMKMAMPMPPKPAARPKAAAKRPAPAVHAHAPSATPARAAPTTTGDAVAPPATTASAPPAATNKQEAGEAPPAATDPMPGMAMQPRAPAAQDTPLPAHAMPHHAMPGMAMSTAPLAYAAGSGTARNPGGDGAMHGLHVMAGDWMLMLHGYAWGIYTDQGGPRGDDEAFVQSMAMLEGARDVAPGTRLQLRAMLSLEPLMGARGYPNLFATGETADGRTQLIDRQHPHDLFMELSGRLDVQAGDGTAFVYGGPVAEPALGPAAFMHRASARYQPLSPITHHWFDSTHISYGVVTAGYAAPHWQFEASAFRGREPDQHRWNIETPALDSWSVRGTWTPSPAWALQVSHGRLHEPEQLEPGRDEARTTASVQYAHHGVSALLAWSNKHKLPGRALTAWLAEANWDIDRHHSLFARAEDVANDELFPDPAAPLHDRRFRIGKLEGGYAYRLPLVGPVDLALGGAFGIYAKPAALDAAYGGFPVSVSLFAKLSLGQ